MDGYNGGFLDSQDVYNFWLNALGADSYPPPLGSVRNDFSDLFPSGASPEGFVESIEQFSRPSSIAHATTPTSFDEAPHMGQGIAQDMYAQGLSHVVNTDFGIFPSGASKEDSTNHLEHPSRPSSNEITEANTPISSDETSSKVCHRPIRQRGYAANTYTSTGL
jgi:hypothetical protein